MESENKRLVLVLEKQLSEASRHRLKELLADLWRQNDVTWVSGLNKAGMMQAEKAGSPYVYNHDYISAEDAVGLLPWQEIWLVAAGKVWKLDQA